MVDINRHKLCALLDRNTIINRDVFDSWFFMKNQMPVNRQIVEQRMKVPYQDYIQTCIDQLEMMNDSRLLQGLGELTDEMMKNFIRTKLRTETIRLLKFYKIYPVLS